MDAFIGNAFGKFGCGDGRWSFGEELREHVMNQLPEGWRSCVTYGTHNVRLSGLASPTGDVYNLDNISATKFNELPENVQQAITSFLPIYKKMRKR